MGDGQYEAVVQIARGCQSRRQLFWFAITGYTAIGIALAYSLGYGSSAHPIGMAFAAAPIPAFIAFSISLVCASRTKRTLTSIDYARMGLWTAVGYGFGVGQMADGYYRHFFPQNADTAKVLGYTFAGVCLGLIVVSILAFPTRKRYCRGQCSACGYDLTASAAHCPECGTELPHD